MDITLMKIPKTHSAFTTVVKKVENSKAANKTMKNDLDTIPKPQDLNRPIMSNTKNDTLGEIPKPQDPNNFMTNNNEPNIDINANLYEPDIDISADINTNTVANTNNTNINKYDIVIGTEKLFNLHGTDDYMTHKENSMGIPKLSKSVNTKTDKFRILLLTSPTAEIPGSTKAEGANMEEKIIGAHVAIQSYCGKYLSCGEESITHGCPSSFTSNINKEERFIMKY
jgi:hypothetical protein